MEFGKHVEKGVWAFAGKALPAVYLLGFIFIVQRVLPKEEFGAYAVVQAIFNFTTAIVVPFAVQPLRSEEHTSELSHRL